MGGGTFILFHTAIIIFQDQLINIFSNSLPIGIFLFGNPVNSLNVIINSARFAFLGIFLVTICDKVVAKIIAKWRWVDDIFS